MDLNHREQKREKDGAAEEEKEKAHVCRLDGVDCERHATIAAIDRVIETRYAVYGRGR